MKMSTKQSTLIHVNEDYIDMELIIPPPPSSSSQAREFEFQMASSISNHEKDSTTSPADDLFYKGKLLPLHLPPRLKMVQNLKQNYPNPNPNPNPNTTLFENVVKSYSSLEDSNFPLVDSSCNIISPSESCRVSTDANNPSDEYLLNWPSNSNSSDIINHNNNNGFIIIGDFPKKSWPNKKLKQMKQFLLSHKKLKSSKAYLRSIFSKSGCSDHSCASNVVGAEKNNKPFEFFADYCNNDNNNKKNQLLLSSCGVMKSLKREILVEEDLSNHRRSFSGVVQRHLSNSSSGSSSTSSSFSLSSAGYYDLQILKRSISANSEIECSVEGAIAHCKNSNRLCGFENSSSSSKICSQFASKVAVCGNQEMAELASTRG